MKRFLTALLLFAMILSLPAAALSDAGKESAALAVSRQAVAVCVDEDMTDLEKLTVLHDWMALRCDYGAGPNSQTAYGALVEGEGNCLGYAEGYACLAEAAGLAGTCTYSQDLDHAWTLATLDGARYFTDCTWDDGKNQKLGLIRHLYFLFNGENAWETGHFGWDSGETVPGGALESVPWTAAMTRVIFAGDWAYYIDGGFRLIRCARDDWSTETLAELTGHWPDEDRSSGRTPLFTGLVLIRNRLYFNTPEAVCYYDLNTGTTRRALTPDTGSRLIYGIGVKDGKLCYSLAESADAVLYDVIDTGISARSAWGCGGLY